MTTSDSASFEKEHAPIGQTAAPEKVKPPSISSTLPKATSELNQHIAASAKRDQLNTRYLESVALSARKALGISETASLRETLQRAVNNDFKVGIHFGGIGRGGINNTEEQAGTGLSGTRLAHNQELSQPKLEKLIKTSIVAKDKIEPQETAATYMFEGGTDLAITIEPDESKNSASSLRADIITLKTILSELKNAGITPDLVTWSNGGFKLTQIMIAGFWSIQSDIAYAVDHGFVPWNTSANVNSDRLTHILSMVKIDRQNQLTLNRPAENDQGKKQHLWEQCFDSGYDALEFMKLLNGADVIIAASPIDQKELAFPVKSTNPNPVLRGVQNMGRALINEAIHFMGTNEGNILIDKFLSGDKLSAKTKLLVGRLLEMGRGQRLNSKRVEQGRTLKLTQELMNNAVGDAFFTYLSDPEGAVVDSTAGGVPTALDIMFGEKAILVQTQERLPYEDKAGNKLLYDGRHNEIKRPEALKMIKTLIAMHRLHLITTNTEGAQEFVSRYIPVKLKPRGKTEDGALKRPVLNFDYNRYLNLKSERRTLPPQTQRYLEKISNMISDKLVGMKQIERVKPNAIQDILGAFVRGFLFDNSRSNNFLLDQDKAPVIQ